MARKPEPPAKLFWLTYRHPDAAGVVVIESHGLLHARLKASLAGADRGLEFASGHQLDLESAGQIPANMIGRFLFWLTYRHPDGRAAGVVVIESHGLLHARLKAPLG
jgi:hypothetical protein